MVFISLFFILKFFQQSSQWAGLRLYRLYPLQTVIIPTKKNGCLSRTASGESSVLKIWRVRSSPLWSLRPSPVWSGVVVKIRVLFTGEMNMCKNYSYSKIIRVLKIIRVSIIRVPKIRVPITRVPIIHLIKIRVPIIRVPKIRVPIRVPKIICVPKML